MSGLVKPGKVLAIYGPRQVGKTSLTEEYLRSSATPWLRFHGEDVSTKAIFSSQELGVLNRAIGESKLVVIDEAQAVAGIGISLKLITDARKDVAVIVTGSSSFELHGQIGEPLVGRSRVIHLFPLWERELRDARLIDPLNFVDFALRFGAYPDVVLAQTVEEKIRILRGLVDGYLLRDVFAFELLRQPKAIVDLLRLLAYQVGSEVSLNELAVQLGIGIPVVSRYLDLLEKCFVIFSLHAFSRNARNEVKKKKKYYFYDLGIRNALIGTFEKMDLRSDVGALWENFCIVERMKWRSYREIYGAVHFWRTTGGKEIDYVEEREGRLDGYEFTWSTKGKKREPSLWKAGYPHATWQVVDPMNYQEFICPV